MKFRLLSIASLVLVIFLLKLSACGDEKIEAEKYASLSPETKHVGMQECRQCHSDKYETFIQTGMGMSFDTASRAKSSAEFFPHAVIRDTFSDLNYFPFWQNDSMFIREFRMNGNDTVYLRTEHVSYIVGSGQHTNSHLINVNGYIYQAPFTFYTQDKRWDLPPGFEGGHNSRFSRIIESECLSCHNAYPEKVEGADNKFSFIPDGIDCERCHGPGSVHISNMKQGKVVDITNSIDYSIVNPAKLPLDLQLDVCQRCHIQGNAVLNDGKSFYDFRPGMTLSEVMNVFMPVYSGSEDEHIMASHAERMKMSPCFTGSAQKAESAGKKLRPYENAMTCITCHDPHVSVRQTGNEVFNSKCISCHPGVRKDVALNPVSQSLLNCTEDMIVRMQVNDNCVRCHMPRGGSIDIPHVKVTDHFIRRPVRKDETEKVREFVALACINNPAVDTRTRGIAFISYYEKFSPNTAFLDSAERYISAGSREERNRNIDHLVHLYYLKGESARVTGLAEEAGLLNVLNRKSVMNTDAWTAYRVGEAYNTTGRQDMALKYFERAVSLAPYQPDFRNKLAGIQFALSMFAEAKENYRFIISEIPVYASAYVSLGYLMLVTENNAKVAEQLYDHALALDPDHVQAMVNKAGVLIHRGENNLARKYLERVLVIQPGNQVAMSLLRQL